MPIKWAQLKDTIIFLQLIYLRKQKIEKKRKMNAQEFIEEEKFDSNPKNAKFSIDEKTNYVCLERINTILVNILDVLELHIGVFNSMEQKEIVQFIYDLQNIGRNNQLGEFYPILSFITSDKFNNIFFEHTYSEPKKWMRGKGRVTIQFGCCYNYAVEKNGIPPGILRNEIVDPIPNLFKIMIK
ncbi:hypothetical protein M5K25_013437 [Dendrobium thyrsiflorum]|uniref:Uncharacterized protein n=1 Tax=Dendrobium thyrsiflorum TaxID=117978 RepID=A0ABD0USX7_DENTH